MNFTSQDFDRWNEQKKFLNSSHTKLFVKEKEVWWAYTGINIGSEQNGDNKSFLRPILVLKVINQELFLGISLTRSQRDISHHVPMSSDFLDPNSRAMCEQIKIYSVKRLKRKLGKIDNELFIEINKKSAEFLFRKPRLGTA